MRPRLDLDFLTTEECEKIIDVIQKDLVLQHLEQQRIWKIKEEIREINEFCSALAKRNEFNENYCLCCFLKFRLLIRRKLTCKQCRLNFCSNCTIDCQNGGSICVFCVKRGQCQRQSLEWFYLSAQSKFKRSGSSKVIQCLSHENSSAGGIKPRSLNISQSSPDPTSCISTSNDHTGTPSSEDATEAQKNVQEKEQKPLDLELLTERFIGMQDSCLEENSRMKSHVAELITFEASLTEMDCMLTSLDNSLLEDHCRDNSICCRHHSHRNNSFSTPDGCCLHHSTNEALLNLAADQIMDITSVGAGVLEKSLNRGAEILEDNNNNKVNNCDGDGDVDDHHSCSGRWNANTKNFAPSADSIRNVNHQNDLRCNENSCQSVRMTSLDGADNLKSVEKKVYKVAGKTYILSERLEDLEDEIIACVGEKFAGRVNYFEEEVTELAVEVEANGKEVESLQKQMSVV